MGFPNIAKNVLFLFTGAILSALCLRWFERRPKLIAYIGQIGIFKLKKRDTFPETEIATHSLIVRNSGKRTAKNIQIIHVNLPEDFVVFPAIEWQLKDLDYGAKSIVFPNLAPTQQITISYLYHPQQSKYIHGEISHDDGMAKIIDVIPTKRFSKPINFVIGILILTGMACWVYLIFLLSKTLIQKYPFL